MAETTFFIHARIGTWLKRLNWNRPIVNWVHGGNVLFPYTQVQIWTLRQIISTKKNEVRIVFLYSYFPVNNIDIYLHFEEDYEMIFFISICRFKSLCNMFEHDWSCSNQN